MRTVTVVAMFVVGGAVLFGLVAPVAAPQQVALLRASQLSPGKASLHAEWPAPAPGHVLRTSQVASQPILKASGNPVTGAAEAPGSRRLARLRADLAAHKIAALRVFWKEIEASGTPLVEPLENEEFGVTFLWRGDTATRSVEVLTRRLVPLESRFLARLQDSDVWYKTVRAPHGARYSYQLSPHSAGQSTAARADDMIPDPLNRLRMPIDGEAGSGTSSVLELPGAPPQLSIHRRAEVPEGRVEHLALASEILGGERAVSVYTPAKGGDQPLPLLIVFDRDVYLSLVPTPTILDNLIATRKIPPLVAVLIGQPDQATRDKELTCSTTFEDFLVKELLPWVSARYRVTGNPTLRVLAGSSYGGLTAACTALRHPTVFGNVLSQSGSFWWGPSDGKQEWVLQQFSRQPRLPLRFYMDVGSLEGGYSDGVGAGQLDSNAHLRDQLRKKGYKVHFAEFLGGHDYVNWRGTLADGLVFLLGR